MRLNTVLTVESLDWMYSMESVSAGFSLITIRYSSAPRSVSQFRVTGAGWSLR